MKTYLVQYGKFRDGKIVDARDEGDAVTTVVKTDYVHVNALQYPFTVFEIKDGKEFMVSSSFEVKENNG